MPNLVWKIDMKVKDITREGLEIKPAQQTPGTMGINIDGKQVGTADAQTAQTIAQASKDGKLDLDQTPDGVKPGQQTNNLGEQPEVLAQVNTKTNPPTVMDNGNVKGSPLGITKSGEEISPELIARSTDWQERSIQANGKTYPALYSGTRGYVVGRQTYQAIMGGMRESDDELARWKNIAGV
jgi:hypothetical protein